jgi:hypothetical protein
MYSMTMLHSRLGCTYHGGLVRLYRVEEFLLLTIIIGVVKSHHNSLLTCDDTGVHKLVLSVINDSEHNTMHRRAT